MRVQGFGIRVEGYHSGRKFIGVTAAVGCRVTVAVMRGSRLDERFTLSPEIVYYDQARLHRVALHPLAVCA